MAGSKQFEPGQRVRVTDAYMYESKRGKEGTYVLDNGLTYNHEVRLDDHDELDIWLFLDDELEAIA